MMSINSDYVSVSPRTLVEKVEKDEEKEISRREVGSLCECAYLTAHKGRGPL